ncbi:AraC family transcriptional regulator [Paenibacillus sp. WST5]|uniref:AraC family transcriptional regulator n=2 Tax=Paenibacillus sedimenti TaxID=2770274 RepID=A0A926KPC8_9BACL|nr:AraC family transcriptional regulator [Paenibacillus sedimenti]
MGKGTFYRKSLVLILLITSIPGLITGLLIYWFSGGRIEEVMVHLHKNQITKRAESIGAQFEHLELSMSHLSFEPIFDFRLLETDFFRQFEVTRDITKTLMVMEGSMPLTAKLEFYLSGSSPVQFTPQFNLLSPDSEENRQLHAWLKQDSSVYWKLTPFPTDSSEKPSLALIHKISGGTMDDYGVLIARTNEAQLQDLLKTLTPYEEGEAFLMQEDGTLLVSSSGQATPEMLDALKKEIANRGHGSSSFIWKWGALKYSVSSGQFERIGTTWTYVSAAPMSAITSPVVFMSKLIVQVSCAGMLLAAVLAWFASRRMYSPLARLMSLLAYGKQQDSSKGRDEFQLIEEEWSHLTRESKALQTKFETQLPQLRQGFLYQLIQGYMGSYTEEELHERMRQYGWNLDNDRYYVLFIRLIGMTHASAMSSFTHGDEGLISFAAANIAQDVVSERFQHCQVINFHDLTVGILLKVDEAWLEENNGLYPIAESLIQTLNAILKLQATISISSSCTQVKQLPWVFEEARNALNYRKWDAGSQILNVRQLKEQERTQGASYPFMIEREMIQAMRTSKLDEAEELLGAFLEALTQGAPIDLNVRQGILNLLGALEREIMQSGLNPNDILAPVNRFEQLSSLRESEQIRKWFITQIIRPFMYEMESRSDHKIKKIVEQAIQFIEHNYMRDISLDECADVCGANVFMLSRSFKQVSGTNFIDYLTDLRMEKAKALLRNSEQKIHDIAMQVGYQHSYFNRLFKKFEGVTPTQFRESFRNT